MIDLYKEGHLAHIQIHDELDFSIESESQAAKIKQIMEQTVDLEVPNKVDYESGPNWGEIKYGDKMFEKYKNKFMVWQLHNRTEIIIAGVSFILGAIIF